MAIELTKKQSQAWYLLTDTHTTEILYGGGAGGSKSFLGCLWLDYCCRTYKGTRWLLGRAVLKTLKETTLNTYFEVLQKHGVNMDSITYNQQSGTLKYSNGSEILLKDLAFRPSDPLFSELGSLEITGAFIDEANQITENTKEVIKSRIRYKLKEYNLIPKMLMGCNPAKNWTYSRFYKPWKNGTLPHGLMFVEAKATDNPHLPDTYIKSLESLTDRVLKERLLYGNWDYDMNPARLMEYDPCSDIFSNHHVKGGTKYITADIARFGQDKTVIIVWNGYRAEYIETIASSTLTVAAEKIRELATTWSVPTSQIICDEDGIGGGVVDILKCKGFTANKTSTKYANAKAECYYLLAEKVNKAELFVNSHDTELIIQELQAIEKGNIDKDTKPSINSKESQKQILGRSPDYADALMMRFWFDINQLIIYGVF